MSEDKKISAEDLFKDYVPEILEYDAKVDSIFPQQTNKKSKKKKENHTHKIIYTIPQKYTLEELKNYIPEILEYDEEVDGSDEYKGRENHLNVKEDLLEKIRNAKAARKSNKTTYRQPIRTENESTH